MALRYSAYSGGTVVVTGGGSVTGATVVGGTIGAAVRATTELIGVNAALAGSRTTVVTTVGVAAAGGAASRDVSAEAPLESTATATAATTTLADRRECHIIGNDGTGRRVARHRPG